MKINQEIRSQEVDTKQVRTSVDTKQSFHQLVQSKTQHLKQQEIQHLMNEIEIQGEKLSRFRSVRDLVKFRRLVQGFLEKTVYDGLGLHESHQFTPEGQGQKLMIVKEIDKKLIELTEEVMNQEKKNVNLLGIIGEIKGMLVNLYM